MTDAEIAALIDSRVAAAVADLPRILTPKAASTAMHEMRQQLRKEFAAEIDKLKAEYDLRISALLQATENLERGLSDDRAEVIDLPPFVRKRSDAA